MKFQLRDAAGNLIQASSPPVWMTPIQTSTTTTQPVNEVTPPDSTDSGSTFSWDPREQAYVFNWRTPKAPAGFYWRIGVRLADGTVHQTYIGLR